MQHRVERWRADGALEPGADQRVIDGRRQVMGQLALDTFQRDFCALRCSVACGRLFNRYGFGRLTPRSSPQ